MVPPNTHALATLRSATEDGQRARPSRSGCNPRAMRDAEALVRMIKSVNGAADFERMVGIAVAGTRGRLANGDTADCQSALLRRRMRYCLICSAVCQPVNILRELSPT